MEKLKYIWVNKQSLSFILVVFFMDVLSIMWMSGFFAIEKDTNSMLSSWSNSGFLATPITILIMLTLAAMIVFLRLKWKTEED